MCGIAGLIYRDGSHDIGADLTALPPGERQSLEPVTREEVYEPYVPPDFAPPLCGRVRGRILGCWHVSQRASR